MPTLTVLIPNRSGANAGRELVLMLCDVDILTGRTVYGSKLKNVSVHDLATLLYGPSDNPDYNGALESVLDFGRVYDDGICYTLTRMDNGDICLVHPSHNWDA